MGKKAVLIGALDTKGQEFLFVKEKLEACGVETFTVDTGVLGNPLFQPDVSADEVARAGGSSIEELRSGKDRGTAIAVMTRGAAEIVIGLEKQGIVGAAFGMGGTAGTTVAASALQGLPIGVPKLMVSTVASGNTKPYIGIKDVTMMYSVVDIAGINQLSRRILSNAAHALAGMINYTEADQGIAEDKVTLGITMFGVTTPCATRVREILEERGYDLLVFHATGTGGLAMEELIKAGYIQGVADITTTELADHLVGGIFDAGPNRLEAAGIAGIPQVVSVGALDMVNFGPPETVQAQFKERTFYQHNPTTTLMRTTIDENRELGRLLATKLNAGTAPTIVVFPKGGVSLLDMDAKPFEGKEERQALYEGIKEHLRSNIPMIDMEQDINNPAVADVIAENLLQLLERNKRG
ncbi:Tm-1-like ATP-binding domain-containing protein [Paenibacillus chondroitinus]|uniref:Tm-1-like ATP-binding domain-containing protein n=1 Tax=Paenibacillus chondroitinus TaxID=59842 RepID=A0ABU6D6M4_9BACL|nr:MULTISPECIES: Tm-1-like ATP-binding domain-containing protein [Paenibacillus]MCY9660060.1 Tm-1-like ATP-binding domain-containing protein [Paenibacillus anseongense]MEB4793081.1 Tm-1-like ATP-binding domain-containing protein [Paenibacillus chondroitinus]